MSIRETVGNLTAWKLGVVLILVGWIVMLGVDHLFISRVFNFIDGVTLSLHQDFQSDTDDMEQMIQDQKDEEAYSQLHDQIDRAKLLAPIDESAQDKFCRKQNDYKILNQLFTLNYLKTHPYMKQSVIREMNNTKESMDGLVANKKIDPNNCPSVQP